MTELLTQTDNGTRASRRDVPLREQALGLFFHAWDTDGRKRFTEADIERELARLRRTER